MKYFCLVVALAFSLPLMAQQQSPQEQEKMLRENIEESLEKYERTLELEYWQVFYVDSILTHDYQAMQEELKELSAKKVSNTDLYYNVQYKWLDSIYEAYQKVFDERQWAKYLKSGAEREKKARDKKRNKTK